jgi:hypothetical protein
MPVRAAMVGVCWMAVSSISRLMASRLNGGGKMRLIAEPPYHIEEVLCA